MRELTQTESTHVSGAVLDVALSVYAGIEHWHFGKTMLGLFVMDTILTGGNPFVGFICTVLIGPLGYLIGLSLAEPKEVNQPRTTPVVTTQPVAVA